jgi:hypothetical protein
MNHASAQPRAPIAFGVHRPKLTDVKERHKQHVPPVLGMLVSPVTIEFIWLNNGSVYATSEPCWPT